MKLIIILLLISICYAERPPFSANRLEQLSGVRATKDPKKLWDQKYSVSNKYVYGKAPANFLVENYEVISPGGKILDMGMGEGRHAVFMAEKGYEVIGVDISSVAIKKAKKLAKEKGVHITGVVASMNKYKIKPGSVDAILCFYYVDRSLVKKMMSWLRPGGYILYEANTVKEFRRKKTDRGSKKFYLKQQELLTMFPGYKVIKYTEPLNEQKYTASILVQKP